MKAVIVDAFGAFDSARYGELPDPSPGPGEVLVDLVASDVNFPDILYIEGRYQRRPPFPFVPGLGGAGRIAALGLGATGLSVGQKVVVLPEHGTYAESIVVPAEFCFPLPDDVPFDIAAALTLVYQTAHFALRRRGLFQPGERVLVLGASGGVGMAAVQLAKAMGSSCVIGATRGAENTAFVREIGADIVIDASAADLHETMRASVLEATDGHGADVVIDPVGGTASAAALRALAWSGRLVVVGFASGDVPAFKGNYLLVKNIAVAGLQWTDYRAFERAQVALAQQEIFDLWRAGRLAPRIAGVLPLARHAEVLGALAAGKGQGKFVLRTRETT